MTHVRLSTGEIWEFKFVKVACNVARPSGETTNQLGTLLQQWFGPNAGLPGTTFTVQFETQNGEWHAVPDSIAVRPVVEAPTPDCSDRDVLQNEIPAEKMYTTHVPVYDLFVAAGDWGIEGSPTAFGWMPVSNHQLKQGMFAAQVTGRSMESQIPNGSWCLFRPCPAGSREGKLLLVQVNTHRDPEDGGRYTVKRYYSTKQIHEDGWTHQTIEPQPLNPNPQYRPIPITEDDADSIRVVGEFVGVIGDE